MGKTSNKILIRELLFNIFISRKDQVSSNLSLLRPIIEDINKKKIKHLFDNPAYTQGLSVGY